ncbi:unnamed protein product [Polarella glacialis]|uniref:Uncharacterized protein n=1 Tax=Polarella glacialis TaxID=89957 RepID=A0A813HVY8_POLGL|nr:unnamed protein product [Polarella glacialis]
MMAANSESESAQSKWDRLSAKWLQRFRISPTCAESWLGAAVSEDGVWGVGCKRCKAAGVVNVAFADFKVRTVAGLQAINFKAHENNLHHRTAAAKYGVGSCINDVAGINAAPTADEFNVVVDAVNEGKATCSSRKQAKMTWCLSEAIKSIDQRFIGESTAVSLFRDERNGRLAIRFRAVTADLRTHCGTLGQQRDFGTGARNITLASHEVMKRACSRFAGAPDEQNISSTPFVKKKLLRHLENTAVAITVDSANDELLSAEMMRSPVLSGLQMKVTPNLRFVVRDKPHASRRLTSRPWGADEVLNEIIVMFCRGRGSVARLVQNSVEVRRVFVGFVKTTKGAVKTVVANMRAAGHRFESMQKPLGRSCFHIHACIKTALHIMRARTDDSSKRAKAWLSWINSEKCLLAAMMADASDQSLQFTRILDNEQMDPAILASEVHSYVASITTLFGDQAKCLTVFGYTSVMLETLRTPVIWQIGNVTHSVGLSGGVPDATIQRCLDRMRSWVLLATAIVASEFPSFESGPDANADIHLERIAIVSGLEANALKAQWQDIFPRARMIAAQRKDAPQDANKDAWRTALSRINSHRITAKCHPTDVLRAALRQYLAFGVSTSGVEQAFSKGAWSFTNRRLRSHATTEEFCLKASLDLPHHDKQAVVGLARRVWAACYGAPRTATRPRIDKGVKRSRDIGEDGQVASEFSFLRKRRKAATEASRNAPRSDLGAAAVMMPANQPLSWGEKHTRELAFQRKKLHSRKVQAAAENSLLPAEDSMALHAEADNAHAAMVRAQRARERAEVRQTADAEGLTSAEVLQKIQNKTAYVDVAAPSPGLHQALGVNSLQQVLSQALADVFVVDQPGQADVTAKIRLASALRGAYLVSPEFMISGHGLALKMHAVSCTPREIFISRNCALHNPQFCRFFHRSLNATTGSRWTLHAGNPARLQALKARWRGQPARLWALVRNNEVGDQAL